MTDSQYLPLTASELTGLVLSGGRSTRFGGVDKGLVDINGVTMVESVCRALFPQVADIVISANRNIASYKRYCYPVITDIDSGYRGPLSGIASVLAALQATAVAVVPCDAMRIPGDLIQKLLAVLNEEQCDIAVVDDGERLQPLFGIYRKKVLISLQHALEREQYSVLTWLRQQRYAIADYSASPDLFQNINSQQDLEKCVVSGSESNSNG